MAPPDAIITEAKWVSLWHFLLLLRNAPGYPFTNIGFSYDVCILSTHNYLSENLHCNSKGIGMNTRIASWYILAVVYFIRNNYIRVSYDNPLIWLNNSQ